MMSKGHQLTQEEVMNESTNVTGNESGENKNVKTKINQQNVQSMNEAGDDEASFDSDYQKNDDEKTVDLDRTGSAYQRTHGNQQTQTQQMQEQQMAGIPTIKSEDTGDRIARRAGMNSGTQGIGTGSVHGYEKNTDDSGLDAAGHDISEDDDAVDSDLDLTGSGGEDIDDVGDVSRLH
jgi:hypothetical protein